MTSQAKPAHDVVSLQEMYPDLVHGHVVEVTIKRGKAAHVKLADGTGWVVPAGPQTSRILPTLQTAKANRSPVVFFADRKSMRIGEVTASLKGLPIAIDPPRAKPGATEYSILPSPRLFFLTTENKQADKVKSAIQAEATRLGGDLAKSRLIVFYLSQTGEIVDVVLAD